MSSLVRIATRSTCIEGIASHAYTRVGAAIDGQSFADSVFQGEPLAIEVTSVSGGYYVTEAWFRAEPGGETVSLGARPATFNESIAHHRRFGGALGF